MCHEHEKRKLLAINSDFFGLFEYLLLSCCNLGTFASTRELSLKYLF